MVFHPCPQADQDDLQDGGKVGLFVSQQVIGDLCCQLPIRRVVDAELVVLVQTGVFCRGFDDFDQCGFVERGKQVRRKTDAVLGAGMAQVGVGFLAQAQDQFGVGALGCRVEQSVEGG